MDFVYVVWNWIPGNSLGDKLSILTFAGAVIGSTYAVYRRMRRTDIESKLEDIKAGQRKIAAEVESLKGTILARAKEKLGALSSGEPAWGAVTAENVIVKDLDAALASLSAAGKTEALRALDLGDVREADSVLSAKISEMERARGGVAREEAALYRQRGALAFLNNTAEALRMYAKAAELDPDNSEFWNELGVLQFRVGDLEAATKSFERVVALGNSLSDRKAIAVATSNLGHIYLARGDLDQAEAIFMKSLAMDKALGRKDGIASNYGNLGSILLTRGDLDQAEEMLKRSVAIDEPSWRSTGMASQYSNLARLSHPFLGACPSRQVEA